MKQRPLLLLCAAFLLAQFAALLHTTQHELAPDGNVPCEICAIAHAATPPMPALLLPPAPQVVALQAPHSATRQVPSSFHACPLATGPPAALV